MTTLVLVRHGQTDWNAEHRWQGHQDIPLNADGRRQAEAVAEALRTTPVDCVVTSDLSRARDTGAAIAAAVNTPLKVMRSLRERSFGRWEGKTNEEIRAEYPDEMAAYQKDRDAFTPPGGQSWNEFAVEAVAAIEAVAADNVGKRIVIAGHGGPLKAFVNYVLGIPRGQFNPFVLDNASISFVRKRQHEITGRVWWQLGALNITSHLDGDRGFAA